MYPNANDNNDSQNVTNVTNNNHRTYAARKLFKNGHAN